MEQSKVFVMLCFQMDRTGWSSWKLVFAFASRFRMVAGSWPCCPYQPRVSSESFGAKGNTRICCLDNCWSKFICPPSMSE